MLRSFQRIGEITGLPMNITGHSARVGAAVTMAENDVFDLAIQQAGGWKSSAMPSRYTEKANHGKSGMSKINSLKN